MEKTKLGIVIPLDAGWSDIGSWNSIWEISKKDENGNVMQGKIFSENNSNCYIRGDSRVISAIGLDNLIIVETRDAILISNKEQTQQVKSIVESLKNEDVPEGVDHKKAYRPWGSYDSLVKENKWQVKIIIVKSGEKLSLKDTSTDLNIG